MAASLNTARALLQAGNFDGARRIASEVLDDNSNDVSAWDFLIQIEVEAREFKTALELIRRVLAMHPDSAMLREREFTALANLRKKREAKRVFEAFKRDFPHQTGRIEGMSIALDALYDRQSKLRQRFDELSDFVHNDATKREHGIVRHKINDLFLAQRLMEEAHPSYPNDYTLNAALAVNSFQLVRPATARRYARLALATDPQQRGMQHLIWASYLQYFPPFWITSWFFTIYLTINTMLGAVASLAMLLVGMFVFNVLYAVWADIASVLLQVSLYKYHFVFWIIATLIYLYAAHPQTFSRFLKRNRTVKLKKY